MSDETAKPIRYCGARVPDPLRGNLAAGRCTLVLNADGRHVGHHKATFSMGKLGKVTFRWATGWRYRRAPVVTLPTARIERQPVLGRQGDKKPDCACPTWWTGHGHTRPCTLT